MKVFVTLAVAVNHDEEGITPGSLYSACIAQARISTPCNFGATSPMIMAMLQKVSEHDLNLEQSPPTC